jgi:hypothetical protein
VLTCDKNRWAPAQLGLLEVHEEAICEETRVACSSRSPFSCDWVSERCCEETRLLVDPIMTQPAHQPFFNPPRDLQWMIP